MRDSHPIRVLVVAANASARWGGEAVLPLHIFRGLRAAGHEAWLLVGSETRPELEELLGDDARFLETVDDASLHVWLRRVNAWLPTWLGNHPLYFLGALHTQWRLRSAARQLVEREGIDLVHQPTPVSPRAPSLLTRLGAPVVIGPMNGGMEYPPGFARNDSLAVRGVRVAGRIAARIANLLVPGKLQAACLLVANERTRAVLPAGARGRIEGLVENGIDADLWASTGAEERSPDRPLELIFLGRLEWWKGAEWLIRALAGATARVPCHLRIVGGDLNGERARLERLAAELGVAEKVDFLGFRPQAQCAELLRAADALVLPSVFECGGAVVLEAMASARAVVAVNWGGPGDYLDSTCGVLIEPRDAPALVADLEEAIVALAIDRERCAALGRAGRARALAMYGWPAKVERLVEIYRDVLERSAPNVRKVA